MARNVRDLAQLRQTLSLRRAHLAKPRVLGSVRLRQRMAHEEDLRRPCMRGH